MRREAVVRIQDANEPGDLVAPVTTLSDCIFKLDAFSLDEWGTIPY
jgi:hypothetical protein